MKQLSGMLSCTYLVESVNSSSLSNKESCHIGMSYTCCAMQRRILVLTQTKQNKKEQMLLDMKQLSGTLSCTYLVESVNSSALSNK